MQCPYYVHKALMKLFDLPEDKIRVIQTETGGGFGGKEEYPSMIAGHAALLAWKSGRPVKIIYDRAEDMVATTKRHPSRTRHRTAVSREGKLLGMEIEFVVDGGAYATLSSVVLSRGTIHAAGPYNCPNVRIRSRAVATNAPPHGAFRGFGAPQSIFALERHLDKVAATVGLAPEELRRRNFIREGETTATGQVIREHVDLDALLERAFELSDYRAKRERFARENVGSAVKRGIGFASFMHGAGFTGSGEKYLQSIVGCEATAGGPRARARGEHRDRAGHQHHLRADRGGGARHRLRTDRVGAARHRPRPEQRPDGRLAHLHDRRQARRVRRARPQADSLRRGAARRRLHAGRVRRRVPRLRRAARRAASSFSQYRQPDDIQWDDGKYRGDAYGAYAWAVYVAEVSVDTVTYEARVEDFVAVQEVGRVIHPVLAAGQIEGGVAQGIGYALYEAVVWQDGRMANGQMTNYIMPTSADLPPIRVHFEEVPNALGPGGAKGIGELPMDGPAPAIVNAVEHATGVGFNHVPLTPEAIMEAFERESVEA